ncbi:MAG: hypothetical protein RLZZ142_2597, partial [Verrucomicrobiota bacterium]
RPSRRDFLCQYGGGFAGLALTHLLARDLPASPSRFPSASSPLPHHPPKVRRVIQLFMNGGISQVDSFLYRPELQRRAGQKDDGKNLFASPFAFAQHGQCGRWISSVFPHHAREVDKMTFLLGMHTDNNIHGTSSYMMNTGFMRAGFPCLGAWVSYGLGQLSENLPAFVVLPDKVGMPYNGEGNFTSGFLSPSHQGTVVRTGERTPIADLFANPRHSFVNPDSDQDGLALLTSLNRSHLATRPADPRLEARIASYEMAARMQLSAPEAFDLSQETPATQAAYGIGSPLADDFGRRCLLARRLVERGVRFVQVWSGHDGPVNNWDNHFDVPKNFPIQAQKVDQPAAALLADLHQRGLLEDTLLLFCTEFGRTPTGQMVGTHPPGRDHNGKSFAIWMAGAGLRPGFAFGDADEFGAKATTDATDHHDLHATILHLLGIDHTQLSVLHNGVNRRLTDVHGRVIHEIFA